MILYFWFLFGPENPSDIKILIDPDLLSNDLFKFQIKGAKLQKW